MTVRRKLQKRSYSGLRRCNFMLPVDLHQKLRRESFEKEVSMSSILVKLLEKHYQTNNQ